MQVEQQQQQQQFQQQPQQPQQPQQSAFAAPQQQTQQQQQPQQQPQQTQQANKNMKQQPQQQQQQQQKGKKQAGKKEGDGQAARSGGDEKKIRKLTNKACIPCRRSHLGCDLARPCTRCVRRGICSECVDPPNGNSKKRKRTMGEGGSDLTEAEVTQMKEHMAELEASNQTLTNALYDMMKEMEELREEMRREKETPSFKSVVAAVAVANFDISTGVLNTCNPHFVQLFQYNQEELMDNFHFARLLPFAGNAEEEWVNLLSHPLPTIATNISLKKKDQTVVACMMELYKQTDRMTSLRIHIRNYADLCSGKSFSEGDFSYQQDQQQNPPMIKTNSYSDIQRMSITQQPGGAQQGGPSDGRHFDVQDAPNADQGIPAPQDALATRRSSHLQPQRASARWSASDLFNSEFGGRGSLSFDRQWPEFREGSGRNSSLFGDFGENYPGMAPLSKGNPSLTTTGSGTGSEIFRNSFFASQRGSQRGLSDYVTNPDDELSSAAFAAANALDLTRNNNQGGGGSGRWSYSNGNDARGSATISTPVAGTPANNQLTETQQRVQNLRRSVEGRANP